MNNKLVIELINVNEIETFKKVQNSQTYKVTRPGRLGNPYSEKKYGLDACLLMYRDHLESDKSLQKYIKDYISSLQRKGIKNLFLACYCTEKDLCHSIFLRDWIVKNCENCDYDNLVEEF